MTVSTAPYYHWNSRSDSQVAPFNSCSPNLVSLQDYYRRRWGAVSLGCHNQRDVTGGGSLSTHAWGAACDPKFPDRATTIQAMDWTIAFSAELGVNTIHDYIRQMMWKPGGVGWVSASIGSVGGAWIHVETTPAAFGDGRPVEDKLPGSGQGGDDFMTPEDQKYLDAKFAAIAGDVWARQFGGEYPPNPNRPAKDWLLDVYGKASAAATAAALAELDDKIDALGLLSSSTWWLPLGNGRRTSSPPLD
jgi:hypothetical protein